MRLQLQQPLLCAAPLLRPLCARRQHRRQVQRERRSAIGASALGCGRPGRQVAARRHQQLLKRDPDGDKVA